jgi:hypothetical protein
MKSIGVLNYFYVWYLCNSMRYIYNIKDDEGNQETLQAMSYKKLVKKLNNKYEPGKIVQVKYKNKKDHDLLKYVKIERVE